MEENQRQLVSDAIDYKGNPADRTTSGVELSERLSTMAIVVNLVTYLVGTMHLSSATSSNISTNFGGTSYMLCLLGGILADTFLTRYRTIAIFAVINAVSQQGCRSCVHRLETLLDPMKGKAANGDFFNVFYLIINIGTLLAVTVLVYIKDKVGRSWGYGICSGFMLLAAFVFVSGTKKYRYKETQGSPVIQILQVLVAAIRKRNVKFPSDISRLYEDPAQELRLSQTNRLRCLDKATIITSKDNKTSEASLTPNPWSLCSVTRVEEVKMLTGVLPIWATTIMFWTVYTQMVSFSVQQALTMERSIGNFEIPAASFNVFMIGSIILTLAIYDRLIMPLFRKTRYSHGTDDLLIVNMFALCITLSPSCFGLFIYTHFRFDKFTKNRLGLLFSIIATVGAALAERKRLSVAKTSSRTTALILPVSGFLLLPQFILVGIGDAFIYAGQLDFFITESPRGMKAIGTGHFLATISLGLFLSTILVEIVRKVTGTNDGHDWLAHRINDGRLDLFYGLLAVLSLINLELFLLCAKMYKPNP
ncbi:hypothetical protein Golax_003253 [Gossypium laxum]|uniref:Major facilitator superfamily protein n=1 Tax=Gossypium laxum TaxID=34288 RepID=A0A7J9AFB4_9ROSI|nr:hypothetical protein [Gossypium laxum]